MRLIGMIVGALLALVGIVWTLQGLGIIGGSFMTGNRMYVIIGPIVVIIGLLALAFGARRRRV
ncbi:MAG: hypothetical protein KGO05_02935 [Chloroflexota bacterium]|nr:hypothetical protein [Chloroflexota bacterium]